MQETQETQIGSLGWQVPLQEEMATPSSILAWKMPWTEEPVPWHPDQVPICTNWDDIWAA